MSIFNRGQWWVLGAIVILVIGFGGCMWTTFDVSLVDKRLQMTGEVEGGEATIRAFAWHSTIYPELPMPMLITHFEISNTSNIDLEIISIKLTLSDPLGRTYHPPLFNCEGIYLPEGIKQGYVLQAGDTRPANIVVALSEWGGPLPLTWTKANLTVTVRPAQPEGMALYWRSEEITIISAGYENGNYTLRGRVEEYPALVSQFRQQKRRAPLIMVLISLYDLEGRFLGSLSGHVPESSEDGGFDFSLPPNEITSADQIATYKVWFAERRP